MQKKMDITGTTAKEASETIEGSVNMMKASWENWLAALGRDDVDMADYTSKLITSVQTVAGNVVPRVAEIVTAAFTEVMSFEV